MKKTYQLFCLLLILTATQACKKNITNPLPNASSHRALVKEIQWTNLGSKAQLTYNPDSTLKTVNYYGTGSSYAINYFYHQKHIVSSDIENDLYKQEYTYNLDNRISNIKRKEVQGSAYTEDLEFSYTANGLVSQLKYYQIGMAGKTLALTSTYQYDANNRLSQINSTDKNGLKSMISIDEYSAAFDYDPLWFVGIGISDNFQLYNVPVLNAMKEIPSKMKRISYNNGQATTEQSISSTFVITNRKIEKQVTVVTYPQQPNYNSTSETLFKY